MTPSARPFAILVGLLLAGAASSALAQDGAPGNQWEATKDTLHQLLANGWSVASVEQEVVPMRQQGPDRMAILTSHFLTLGRDMARCDEAHFRPPYEEKTGLAPPLGAPPAPPSSTASCSRLTAPK